MPEPIISTNTVAVLAAKPISGLSAAATAVLSCIAYWFGFLTTGLAFFAGAVGLLIVIWSFKHSRHQARMDKLEEEQFKKTKKRFRSGKRKLNQK